MRSWLRLLCLAAASASLTAVARADPAFAGSGDATSPYLPTPTVSFAAASEVAKPPEPPRAEIEVLLGLPTAVRFQYAVVQQDGFAAMLEGLAGSWIPPVVGLWVLAPVAGGGVRARIPVWCGERNAFFIKPGVDAYGLLLLLPPPFGGGPVALVGGDAELIWAHRSGRCVWEAGVDLGALVNVNGGSGVAPLISLVGGLRF